MALLFASVLNKLPKERIIQNQKVYRGLALPTEHLNVTYSKGAIIEELGFVSSSLDRTVADDFSYGNIDHERVIFVINSKNGRLISNLFKKSPAYTSDTIDEMEVIFLPRTKFKITDIYTQDYRRIIELDEIVDEG